MRTAADCGNGRAGCVRRTGLTTQRLPLPSSGAFLALVTGFPHDIAVADSWEALQRERALHGQAEVDVSVYYPLA
ncbi:hypothetical protein ACFVJ4_41040 [Streptomyces sp. NPDC127178]|uniref:hypothetical protein n=1 Tax=unclassified Streptomyces TaxID=2593676 RepID=UPI003641D96E